MPGVNKRVLAENYGFAYAVLKSNNELSRVFDQAVKGTWTPDRFLAAVRNTKWYKKTSESARNAQVQKKSDPATYEANLAQVRARIRVMANEFGAQAGGNRIEGLAEKAYRFGWDDNQLRAHLAGSVRMGDNSGLLEGQAGEWERQWREHANAMGVRLPYSTARKYARAAVRGTLTPEDVIGRINKWSKSKYPHLADRITGGETVEDIAEPYRQSAADLLEMDAGRFRVTGPTLSKALSRKDSEGRPTTMSVHEFEDFLRQDPRWKRTNNAKQQADALTNNLLQSWGLI